MLREWQEKDRYNCKPDLEGTDLEILQEEISIAYNRQCAVHLNLWKDEICFRVGIIKSIQLEKSLLVLLQDRGPERFSFAQIIGIRIME